MTLEDIPDGVELFSMGKAELEAWAQKAGVPVDEAVLLARKQYWAFFVARRARLVGRG